MPDWITHSMIGWMTGKALKTEVGLLVIGSLIPDLVKINLITKWFGADLQGFFNPFHTPFGSLLVGGILALFFTESLKAFFTLIIGISTHFIADFFLIGTTKGFQFLFPFSWDYWRFNEIVTDYRITIIALFTALTVYIYFYYRSLKTFQPTQQD